MPAVLFGLFVVLVVLSWWFCAVVLMLPIALGAARWGVLAGAAASLVVSLLLLTGLIGKPHTVTAADAARLRVADETGAAPLDFAWPVYLYVQCWHDLAENVRLVRRGVALVWRRAWRLIPRVSLEGMSAEVGLDLAPRPARWPTVLLGWPLLLLPAAFLAGATAGACLSLLVLLVTATAVLLAAIVLACAVLAAAVAWSRGARRLRRSSACCTHCYHVTRWPAYACPGEHGSLLLHRRLRPGLCGLWSRRCGCGLLLPTTAARIARRLRPHCPRCGEPLYQGAGYATDVRLVVLGAPRAGKSSLLASAIDSITADPGRGPVESSERGGTVTLRFTGRRRPRVVHLFAPGGELLQPARRRELSYLDHAYSVLYVLDPLSIPGLRKALLHQPGLGLTPGDHATDDPVEAFDGVIAEHRSFSGATSGVIAVTVVKKDLLEHLGDQRLGTSSAAVRRWIERHGAGRIIWPVEHDFRGHRYFLVSARDAATAAEPVRWLLRAEGFPVAAGPKAAP